MARRPWELSALSAFYLTLAAWAVLTMGVRKGRTAAWSHIAHSQPPCAAQLCYDVVFEPPAMGKTIDKVPPPRGSAPHAWSRSLALPSPALPPRPRRPGMQAGNARPVALLAGKVHAQYIVEGFAGGGLLLLCALGLVALDAVRSRATGGAAVVRSSAHCGQTMRPRPFRGA